MDEKTQSHLDLIRELDELIVKGQWEGSLFYQAVGKKLREFSEQLKTEYQVDTEATFSSPNEMMDYVKQKAGLIEVFISVYCTEGRNIKKWELVLANLPKQIVSRPIYKKEKDIKDSINIKDNPVNDAYVVVYVTEMDILKPSFRDKVLADKFGHELLRLKEDALKPENITKLVHLTGEYAYRKGLLTKL
jgi:intracellular multiplication protein IcmQ